MLTTNHPPHPHPHPSLWLPCCNIGCSYTYCKQHKNAVRMSLGRGSKKPILYSSPSDLIQTENLYLLDKKITQARAHMCMYYKGILHALYTCTSRTYMYVTDTLIYAWRLTLGWLIPSAMRYCWGIISPFSSLSLSFSLSFSLYATCRLEA